MSHAVACYPFSQKASITSFGTLLSSPPAKLEELSGVFLCAMIGPFQMGLRIASADTLFLCIK